MTSESINLDKLRASLPKGLISRIAKDEGISIDKIRNALYGRTTGIESLEILEKVIKHRDEFNEFVKEVNKKI